MTPQEVIDTVINPLLALHKGAINVEKYENGVVYVTMKGGCQGCARAKATMALYVEKVIKAKIPEVTSVIDITDHAAGTDPYFKVENDEKD